MSHVICPFCGSNEHTSGYGLAAGPMGAYTFCNDCDELIEFSSDLEGLDDETAVRLKKMESDLNAKLEIARLKLSKKLSEAKQL